MTPWPINDTLHCTAIPSMQLFYSLQLHPPSTLCSTTAELSFHHQFARPSLTSASTTPNFPPWFRPALPERIRSHLVERGASRAVLTKLHNELTARLLGVAKAWHRVGLLPGMIDQMTTQHCLRRSCTLERCG
jgi:hypothetical protein